MTNPILMTEDYWMSSPFSIARHYGRMKHNGTEYVVVNKEGKTLYECSAEAYKAGREYAIEPGEPCDLIDKRYLEIYKKAGRDKFIEMVKSKLTLKEMKKQ